MANPEEEKLVIPEGWTLTLADADGVVLATWDEMAGYNLDKSFARHALTADILADIEQSIRATRKEAGDDRTRS